MNKNIQLFYQKQKCINNCNNNIYQQGKMLQYIYQDLDECGIYNCIILLSMLTYNLENIELKLGQL